MGNSNNSLARLSPDIPQYRAKIGIARDVNAGCSFQKLRDNVTKADLFLTGSGYSPHASETNVHTAPTHDMTKDIFDRVNELYHNIQDKEMETRIQLLENPYFPWRKKLPTYWTYRFDFCLSWLKDPCLLVLCFVTLLPGLITLLPFLLGLFLSYFFGVILDIFTCRLFFCRGSAKEQEWIRNFTEQNPDLDGDRLDEMVSQGMQEIVEYTRVTYPEVNVIYWTGVERIECPSGEGKAHYLYLQEFMLMIVDDREYLHYATSQQHNNNTVYRHSRAIDYDEPLSPVDVEMKV